MSAEEDWELASRWNEGGTGSRPPSSAGASSSSSKKRKTSSGESRSSSAKEGVIDSLLGSKWKSIKKAAKSSIPRIGGGSSGGGSGGWSAEQSGGSASRIDPDDVSVSDSLCSAVLRALADEQGLGGGASRSAPPIVTGGGVPSGIVATAPSATAEFADLSAVDPPLGLRRHSSDGSSLSDDESMEAMSEAPADLPSDEDDAGRRARHKEKVKEKLERHKREKRQLRKTTMELSQRLAETTEKLKEADSLAASKIGTLEAQLAETRAGVAGVLDTSIKEVTDQSEVIKMMGKKLIRQAAVIKKQKKAVATMRQQVKEHKELKDKYEMMQKLLQENIEEMMEMKNRIMIMGFNLQQKEATVDRVAKELSEKTRRISQLEEDLEVGGDKDKSTWGDSLLFPFSRQTADDDDDDDDRREPSRYDTLFSRLSRLFALREEASCDQKALKRMADDVDDLISECCGEAASIDKNMKSLFPDSVAVDPNRDPLRPKRERSFRRSGEAASSALFYRRVFAVLGSIALITAASLGIGYAVVKSDPSRRPPFSLVASGSVGTKEQHLLEMAERVVLACSESALDDNMARCQNLCHSKMCCFEAGEYSCKEVESKNCAVYAGCEALLKGMPLKAVKQDPE